MFVWGVLKRGIPESVRFCIDDLPMYIFFIPTHPYLKPCITSTSLVNTLLKENLKCFKQI